LETVKVVIRNLNHQEITIDFPERSLLYHFDKVGIDWMQACGQKGRCTTCAFQILEGEKFLSDLTESELRFKELGRLKLGYRLACQTKTCGPIVIRVPNGLKLPHLNYSEE